MTMALAAVVLAALAVRSLPLPADPVAIPVTIEVPKGFATTIVVPQGFAQVRGAGLRAFGVEVVQYRPEGRVLVRPSGLVAEVTLGVLADRQGPPTMKVHLVVGGAPGDSEVRLVRTAPPGPTVSGARRALAVAAVAVPARAGARVGGGTTGEAVNMERAARPLSSSPASAAPPTDGIERKGAEPSKPSEPVGKAEGPKEEGVAAGSAAPMAPSAPSSTSLDVLTQARSGEPPGLEGVVAASVSVLELQDLAHAEVQVIGRREGQPGYPWMTLENVARGEKWAFVRLTLASPTAEIESISWEGKGAGPKEAPFEAKSLGRELKITAQLPLAAATSRTRVRVRVRGGGVYTFPLRDGSILHWILR
jgi:hypothetical protein